MPATALVISHMRLHREALAAIDPGGSIAVVGGADGYQTALVQASRLRPEVVVVDMKTPRALEIIRDLRNMAIAPKLVAFGVDDEQQIVDCLEAGALAYGRTDEPASRWIGIIHDVLRGELSCSPRIAAIIAMRLAARAASDSQDDEQLTKREQEVLRFMQEGLSNKEIGRVLFIAEATVKNHVHRILEKLHVRTRSQAVARFSRLGGLLHVPVRPEGDCGAPQASARDPIARAAPAGT